MKGGDQTTAIGPQACAAFVAFSATRAKDI
jgi:hypothetical protein